MNKQYIKRQITLHKLGLPMNNDIREIYEYFHKLLGDINELEKITLNEYSNSIFWTKHNVVLLQYDTELECFWVNYNDISEKFRKKFNFKYKNISEIISIMLEDTFNLKVNTSYSLASVSSWILENMVRTKHKYEQEIY